MKNPKAMFALSYGLFVLTARQGEKDNGCIINTAMQVTSEPNRIIITVNKTNYTHDMVLETGRFTLSVLSEQAEFSTFQRFGFQSGRDVDKFDGFQAHAVRGEYPPSSSSRCHCLSVPGRTVLSAGRSSYSAWMFRR